VLKVRVVDQVTQFHQPIIINSKPDQKSEQSEMNRPNETIWFYPRVSTIISDWPEAASFCLVYKSSNSTFPCHFCLVKKDDLANINLPFNDVVPRTHNEMRRYLENNTPNSASIESVPNFFWNLP